MFRLECIYLYNEFVCDYGILILGLVYDKEVLIGEHTVYWEIFEVQNFKGLVILKFFANKFSRMAI